MDKKHILKSKTFWINIISLICMLVQVKTGFITSAEVQAALLTITNIALRLVTKSEIGWKI